MTEAECGVTWPQAKGAGSHRKVEERRHLPLEPPDRASPAQRPRFQTSDHQNWKKNKFLLLEATECAVSWDSSHKKLEWPRSLQLDPCKLGASWSDEDTDSQSGTGTCSRPRTCEPDPSQTNY